MLTSGAYKSAAERMGRNMDVEAACYESEIMAYASCEMPVEVPRHAARELIGATEELFSTVEELPVELEGSELPCFASWVPFIRTTGFLSDVGSNSKSIPSDDEYKSFHDDSDRQQYNVDLASAITGMHRILDWISDSTSDGLGGFVEGF